MDLLDFREVGDHRLNLGFFITKYYENDIEEFMRGQDELQ